MRWNEETTYNQEIWKQLVAAGSSCKLEEFVYDLGRPKEAYELLAFTLNQRQKCPSHKKGSEWWVLSYLQLFINSKKEQILYAYLPYCESISW